jgi:hypothetical protein
MSEGYCGRAHQRGRDQVAAFCLGQPLGRLVSWVVPDHPDTDADASAGDDVRMTVADFVARTLPNPDLQQFLLGQLWSETARVRLAHRVDRVVLWAPERVAARVAGGEPTEWITLPNVETPGGDLVARVIRLDCSARTPSRDLRLFTSVVTPVSRG